MRRRLTIKDHKMETSLFSRRLLVGLAFILVFTAALLIRLIYLQIIKHKFYSTLSRQNIVTIIPVAPNRGLIYDRNGVLLAKDIPVFSLAITPGRVQSLKKTINQVRSIIHIDKQDLEDFHKLKNEYHLYQPVPLKLALTPEEIAKFYVNAYRFPGVSIQSHMMRFYPLGGITSNVVGYVGRINVEELKQLDSENYRASDYIGKVGIEKYYEKILHGKVGSEEAETDASGRIVRILKKTPPIPGKNIYLTIDSKLQAFSEKALGSNSGAIVAIQPQTGEILALVTKPNFDPNLFVNGLSKEQYQNLVNNPEHPLYNRAIRGLYSPASTIKPFYALAALDEGIITPQYEIYDRGWFQLPNTEHIYHDWKHNGHGWVNVTKAITVSCDTFFYNLAVDMGIGRMDELLNNFGFGQITGIDMPEELNGLVPTPSWKMQNQGKGWFTGDSIIMGIGQGSLLVTPLQLAAATAILALHGQRIKPHLLLKTVTANGQTTVQQPIAEQAVVLNHPNVWNIVINAMRKVVSSPRGTAAEFGRHPDYTVAAKTGTAQVFGTYRNEELNRTNIPKRLRNHHLFIMFAPVKNPKIVLAVVVEHASFADKIAREVTDFYFRECASPAKETYTNADPGSNLEQQDWQESAADNL